MEYRIREYGQGSILGLEEAEAVLRALRQETLSFGPLRDEFDQALGEYLGVPHAMSVSSCTPQMSTAMTLPPATAAI